MQLTDCLPPARTVPCSADGTAAAGRACSPAEVPATQLEDKSYESGAAAVVMPGWTAGCQSTDLLTQLPRGLRRWMCCCLHLCSEGCCLGMRLQMLLHVPACISIAIEGKLFAAQILTRHRSTIMVTQWYDAWDHKVTGSNTEATQATSRSAAESLPVLLSSTAQLAAL